MRKVKCVIQHRTNLTLDKIYDVINLKKTTMTTSNGSFNNIKVLLKNDKGEEDWYIIKGNITRTIFLKDVTPEYRCETIDGILE